MLNYRDEVVRQVGTKEIRTEWTLQMFEVKRTEIDHENGVRCEMGST